MLSAVPPELLIRAVKRGRAASAGKPDPFHRVPRSKPSADLINEPEKRGIGFVLRREGRLVMGGVSLAHTRLSVLETQSILKRRTFFSLPGRIKIAIGS